MLFTNILCLICYIFKMAPFFRQIFWTSNQYSSTDYGFKNIIFWNIYIFFTSLKIFKEHHVVRTFIFTLVFNLHPFLEHLHNLHIANYTELYSDMLNCSEKGLQSVFPDHSIWKTLLTHRITNSDVYFYSKIALMHLFSCINICRSHRT
jgi:hypothetical protein